MPTGFTDATQGNGARNRVVDQGDGTLIPIFTSGIPPANSLTNAGNATGTAVDGGVAHANAQMVVTSGAGVSAGSVQMQGSLDNVNWFNIGAAVTTNAANTTFAPILVTGTAVRYVRAVSSSVVGGTVSAVLAMSG